MSEEAQKTGLLTAAKVIAIIAFALVMTALAVAIIGDVAIFAQQILAFIGACLLSVIVFIIGFFLMLVSCIFIFGIYLLGEYGFWPLGWAFGVFTQIMDENKITQDQISAFVGLRIVLIILCILGLILGIVALSLNGAANSDNDDENDFSKPVKKDSNLPKAFGTLSVVFSALGIFAAVLIFLIAAALS